MPSQRTYLDHAASSPLLPEAAAAWQEAAALVGNPSSLHAAGRRARRLVEESRESIAADLGVRAGDVVFTSGGTESDNLAVKGIAWAAPPERRRIVCAPTEHHAVLDPVLWLGDHGYDVTWLPVDPDGRIGPDDVVAALDDDVALCCVMWANNEIGTVAPIAEIAAACSARGVPLQVDAVQALGHLPVDAGLPGIAALAVSGHKIGAPIGTGALVLRRDVVVTPLTHGGGQERDVRSGTVDAAGAAALAVAVRAAVTRQAVEAERLTVLRDRLISGIQEAVPDAVVNGNVVERLPGNVNMSFPGCEGDALLMLLDAAGVEVSTGSACTSGVPEPSHVLLALGADPAIARGTLRFSLGRTSVDADVDAALAALPGAVERARRAGARRLARPTS